MVCRQLGLGRLGLSWRSRHRRADLRRQPDQHLPLFGNGLYPWFQDFQGDIDLIGQRKPQNYWRSVVYGSSPIEMMVERPAPAGTEQFANNWSYYDELASWTWDVPQGQDMTVHVYTTGDSVNLLLNGNPSRPTRSPPPTSA